MLPPGWKLIGPNLAAAFLAMYLELPLGWMWKEATILLLIGQQLACCLLAKYLELPLGRM